MSGEAPEIVYADGEDDASPMGAMLAGLISANIEQNPERWDDFHKLSISSVLNGRQTRR